MKNLRKPNYNIVTILFLSLIVCMSGLSSYAQSHVVEISHYLFPDFIKGSVFMKTGIRQETIMNYNTLTEEMVFQDKGKILAIGNESVANIDSIIIKDRKFIPVEGKFFEVLYESGHQILAEHKCRVNMPGSPVGYGGTSHTSSVTSVSSLQSDGLFYQLKLPDNYETKPYTNYWIQKEGELTIFINMRQLRRIYNNKRSLFDAFVKEHDVKYENEESLIRLINHMEKGL
jgi:hypothetical protein